jgi:AcrR family transcriptional regulator
VSRETIKQAALELFRRYSYVKTSVSDIAAAAGIGKGTVYLSFKTKEDILFALLDDEINSLNLRDDPAFLDPSVDLDIKLGRFSVSILDLLFQIRDLMFGSLENLRGRELQDVYLKLAQYIDRVTDFLSHILELHGYQPVKERAAAIREFVLFLAGRFIVYILSHDWNYREELYLLVPVWARLIFRPLVLPERV